MKENIGKAFKVFKSWFGKILLLVIVTPVLLGFLANCQAANKEPDVAKVPWCIITYLYTKDGSLTYRTPSHTYYGESYAVVNKQPALENWYEWNGKKYIKHEGVKVFDSKEWGAIDVIKRGQK